MLNITSIPLSGKLVSFFLFSREMDWFAYFKLWFPLRHFGVILYVLKHKDPYFIKAKIKSTPEMILWYSILMADDVWLLWVSANNLCTTLVYMPANGTFLINL